MPANTQPANQTEDADRETIFKLFQAIAAYGHRVRTEKKFLLPENAESLSSVDEENSQRPDKRKEKSSEL